MAKIIWEPPESEKMIEHSGLIEKFVDCYIVKEIFPEINPFLFKLCKKDAYGNIEQPQFEQIELCASGDFSLSFNPRKLSRYEVDIFGKSESRTVTRERSRIGRIYHGRFFTSEKEYELNAFYFSPSSGDYNMLAFRTQYAKDIVQLIYNKDFHNANCDESHKQVFDAKTGQIFLVKEK